MDVGNYEYHICAICGCRVQKKFAESNRQEYGKLLCFKCSLAATKGQMPIAQPQKQNPVPASVAAAGQPKQQQKAVPPIICMDDIAEETVDWLWHPYIPLGKICDVMGDPGNGKTFFSCALAAAISTGGGLPSGDGFEKCEPGNVIFQTCEDGLSDTIRPRLSLLGADLKRIFVIDETREPISLSDARLEAAIKEKQAKLVIIDPLQGYLGSDVDMHRANEIRPVMAHIGRLAAENQCTILLVTHMSKSGQDRAIYKNLGSIDIAAAARSILMIGKDPKTGQRAICHIKSSLAPAGQSLAFDLDQEHGFLWKGTSTLTADDLLSVYRFGGEASGLDEAKEFILDVLKDGPLFASKIINDGAACGIKRNRIERARDVLIKESRLKKHKSGYHTGWVWEITQECLNKNEQKHSSVGLA